MIKYFLDDFGVTTYQTSQYISSLVYGLLIPIIAVAIPRLSSLFSSNQKEEAFKLHTDVMNSYFMFSIPALVGLALLSTEVINIYGGSGYLDCIVPLAIYSIAQLISSLNYILGDALLYILGQERKLVIINSIGGILNVVLNFLLLTLGIFSVESSILSLLISYLCVGIIDYTYIRKKVGYKIKLINVNIVTYLIFSICFIPVVLLIKKLQFGMILGTIISVIACGSIYFIGLLLTKNKYFMKYFDMIKNKFLRRGIKDE